MQCTFKGCLETTDTPFADGWRHLTNWGKGVRGGLYCPGHAQVLEQVLNDRELNEEQAKFRGDS